MEIDRKTVLHVANLANLRLSEEDIVHYQDQLGKVLGYIGILEKLGNDQVVAKNSDVGTPERSDDVVPSLPVEESLSQAPQKIGTAFQVPRILE